MRKGGDGVVVRRKEGRVAAKVRYGEGTRKKKPAIEGQGNGRALIAKQNG